VLFKLLFGASGLFGIRVGFGVGANATLAAQGLDAGEEPRLVFPISHDHGARLNRRLCPSPTQDRWCLVPRAILIPVEEQQHRVAILLERQANGLANFCLVEEF